MMFFWVIVVLLIIAALLFIIPPLLQRPDSPEGFVKREELSIEVFKDQVLELERDLSNGTLSQEQFELAKHDIERELLESTKAEKLLRTEGSDIADSMAAKASAWVIIIALPILTITFYNAFGGGPQAFDDEAQQQPQVAAEGHQGSDVEQMIISLTERLDANPDDAEGWAMLGRSYYFVKDYPRAAKAYEMAIETAPSENADIYADYADAKALANNRNLQGAPLAAAERAIAINPNHVKALWLAGTGAYQIQDWKKAKRYWEQLMKHLEPGSDNARMISANLDEIYQMLGVEAPKSNIASISGTVELDPAIAASASPSDVVFIFARAANGPGMPLAILRKTVSDLPMSFTLDDTMAMRPNMKLSSFDELVVGARVSKSGMAMAEAGDLQGLSGVVKLSDTNDVNIIISEIVK